MKVISKAKKTTLISIVFTSTIVLLFLTILVCGILLFLKYHYAKQNDIQLSYLTEVINTPSVPKEQPQDNDITSNNSNDDFGTGDIVEDKIDGASRLKEENADFVAWLQVVDTDFNFPIMQSPNQAEYYLRRGFDKKYNINGTPFIDVNCKPNLQSDNTIIYGHNMDDKSMFGFMENYLTQDYAKAHDVMTLTTPTNTYSYTLISVFKTHTGSDGFDYNYTDFDDKQDFDDYIDKIKSLSVYDTDITASSKEQFLTLSTCDYSQKNGRLALVLKRIN